MHVAVTVGAPLADAVLEGGADRVVHIESEAGDDCRIHHDHLFCQICRTVVLAGRNAEPVRLSEGSFEADGVATIHSAGELPSSSGAFAPLGSRAPPRA
jgi:hypothetical protein